MKEYRGLCHSSKWKTGKVTFNSIGTRRLRNAQWESDRCKLIAAHSTSIWYTETSAYCEFYNP